MNIALILTIMTLNLKFIEYTSMQMQYIQIKLHNSNI